MKEVAIMAITALAASIVFAKVSKLMPTKIA